MKVCIKLVWIVKLCMKLLLWSCAHTCIVNSCIKLVNLGYAWNLYCEVLHKTCIVKLCIKLELCRCAWNLHSAVMLCMELVLWRCVHKTCITKLCIKIVLWRCAWNLHCDVVHETCVVKLCIKLVLWKFIKLVLYSVHEIYVVNCAWNVCCEVVHKTISLRIKWVYMTLVNSSKNGLRPFKITNTALLSYIRYCFIFSVQLLSACIDFVNCYKTNSIDCLNFKTTTQMVHFYFKNYHIYELFLYISFVPAHKRVWN